MSGTGNPLNAPLYWASKNDSRVAAQLGRTFHWQGLTDEGKHNEQNPGRGLTKGGIAAASYFLPWLWGADAAEAGSTGASAGDAAVAADAGAGAYDAMSAAQIAQQLAPIAEGENVGSLLSVAGGTPASTEAAALSQAAQTAPQAGGLLNSLKALPSQTQQLASQAAYRTMVPGVGGQQADMLAAQTGEFGPYGLGQTMQAASGAQGLSPLQSSLGNYGGKVLSGFGKAANSKMGQQMMTREGMSLMSPRQQQPMAQGRPAPQGQQQPLVNPYQNSLTMANSGMQLTEEQKQKLRMMGYQV